MTISVVSILVLSFFVVRLSVVSLFVFRLQLVLTERPRISRVTETAEGGVLQVVPTLAVVTGRRITETQLTQRTCRVISVRQTVRS